jgi:hypothetical protein
MSGQRTSYRVELLDEKGVVISSAPVFTIPAHQGSGGCGCGPSTDDAVEPPFAFIAAMPDVGEGYTLRIREGDDIVWQRQRPSVTPELDPVKVSVRKGQLYVSWSFTVAPETEPEIWLRWSEDGENWHGLAVGLSGDSAEIDPAAIPAERVSIQVIAHDGFNSVSAQSRFVKLPEKQLSLAILRPEDNGQYDEGKPLHLWGSIISGTTEEEPTWLIDDEEVGQGLDTWVPSVEAGEHKVELRAPGAEPVIHQIVIGGYAIED